jgi:hypothetical protein
MPNETPLNFFSYKWCPRAPDKETSREEHNRQFLVHILFEGRWVCIATEMLLSKSQDLHGI